MEKEFKTSKDYPRKKAPIVWAVISSEGVVMDSGFLNRAEAENFRDNAYFGYYDKCTVECYTRRVSVRRTVIRVSSSKTSRL